MSIDFDGQAAIITGTDSGLERAHAAGLARRNARAVADSAATDSIANMDNAGGFTLPPDVPGACANAWKRHEQ